MECIFYAHLSENILFSDMNWENMALQNFSILAYYPPCQKFHMLPRDNYHLSFKNPTSMAKKTGTDTTQYFTFPFA